MPIPSGTTSRRLQSLNTISRKADPHPNRSCCPGLSLSPLVSSANPDRDEEATTLARYQERQLLGALHEGGARQCRKHGAIENSKPKLLLLRARSPLR
jgi:hypothetical protein